MYNLGEDIIVEAFRRGARGEGRTDRGVPFKKVVLMVAVRMVVGGY
jgi:hypothetical protein